MHGREQQKQQQPSRERPPVGTQQPARDPEDDAAHEGQPQEAQARLGGTEDLPAAAAAKQDRSKGEKHRRPAAAPQPESGNLAEPESAGRGAQGPTGGADRELGKLARLASPTH